MNNRRMRRVDDYRSYDRHTRNFVITVLVAWVVVLAGLCAWMLLRSAP